MSWPFYTNCCDAPPPLLDPMIWHLLTFFLWGYIKDNVYVPFLPQDLNIHEVANTSIIASATPNMLHKTWENSVIKLMCVVSPREGAFILGPCRVCLKLWVLLYKIICTLSMQPHLSSYSGLQKMCRNFWNILYTCIIKVNSLIHGNDLQIVSHSFHSWSQFVQCKPKCALPCRLIFCLHTQRLIFLRTTGVKHSFFCYHISDSGSRIHDLLNTWPFEWNKGSLSTILNPPTGPIIHTSMHNGYNTILTSVASSHRKPGVVSL